MAGLVPAHPDKGFIGIAHLSGMPGTRPGMTIPMNYHLFSAFLLITVVLFLTPGPIVTLIIATARDSGTRAALLTVAGATTGNALLVACIAIGLGWILKTSAEIFDYLRWIGAAYLIWLGIQAWRHAGATAEAAPPGGHVTPGVASWWR